MYRIDIVTIFPEIFRNFFCTSIIKRAQDMKKLSINTVDLRMFTEDKHRKVDDEPYGGGSGMVLKPEPVIKAVRSLKKHSSKVIMLSPQGVVFNQAKAKTYAESEQHLILLCGRYEGFDERVFSVVDEEISVGDFVVNGGEVPSMLICEAIVRLLPKVLGSKESYENDSFYNKKYLDYPHYTRPTSFEGMDVPKILLTGNHKNILYWRESQAKLNTYKKRPDLLSNKEIKEIEKTELKER